MEKKLPEEHFKITNGPSKFDLMSSLFEGKVVKISCDILSANLNSELKIKIYPVVKVRFILVGPEDGSNESWFGKVRIIDEDFEHEDRKFYYSSKHRTGTMHKREEKESAIKIIEKM